LLVDITDPNDERVADYVRLTDPDLRRARELSGGTDGGFFIAEGVQVIRALLGSSYPVRSLFLSPRRWADLEPLVPPAVTVYLADQEVLNAVSGFPMHRGALASATRLPLREVADVCGRPPTPLVVATEGVNDHENLGAMFRNAAAFGAGAVLLDPTSCDPLYRRCVRVSMGHVLRKPFTRWRGGAAGVRQLQELGYEVVALTPASGDPVDVRDVPPARHRVLLVGAEGGGLSDELLAAADLRVSIPMAAGVDSINVAAATAVALHALRPS
jgi:tRNA G18 (ribose-2'-O)-methylase SpoU